MKDLEVSFDEYLPLKDVVLNTLRTAILTGELAPGERLMEVTIANKLGVSRTPVREAIRRLETEGLVTMLPRRGAMVSQITEKDLRDVLEVRLALERLAIILACERITDEEVVKLREASSAFERVIKSKRSDISEIVEKDEMFHDILYFATRNDRLTQVLSNLREQMYRYRLEYLKDADYHDRLIEEHKKIQECVKKRDTAGALEIMQEHILAQENVMIEAVHKKAEDLEKAKIKRNRTRKK
ncbi:MAG: GntR family transcriptional regulator [Lachnospiraceae bacterium]|nr:GntR family transcriptional regulator [Lachnospiraceae bacterium]